VADMANVGVGRLFYPQLGYAFNIVLASHTTLTLIRSQGYVL